VYLLASVIVAIAAVRRAGARTPQAPQTRQLWHRARWLTAPLRRAQTGSIYEYSAGNPIFGVLGSDSFLYAPILGIFTFTGFPLVRSGAATLWRTLLWRCIRGCAARLG
jgi:hypothetical protein